MSELISIQGLDFELRRSDRRRTFGLTVDRSGTLVAHVPSASPRDEIERWISTKLLWAHKKLLEKEQFVGDGRPPEFVSGETIHYLGKTFRLRVVERQPKPLVLDGEWFVLRMSARPKASVHFRQWFIEEGKEWLLGRAKRMAARIGARPDGVVVSDLGFRWGSCGRNGVVYFNWRVLQLPPVLVDYLIAHELTHLLHHNHSPEFWAALERAMPDWRDRQQRLDRQWHKYAAFAVTESERRAVGPKVREKAL